MQVQFPETPYDEDFRLGKDGHIYVGNFKRKKWIIAKFDNKPLPENMFPGGRKKWINMVKKYFRLRFINEVISPQYDYLPTIQVIWNQVTAGDLHEFKQKVGYHGNV
jgi:hypothetical protein